jgi:hypothetical protein
MRILKETTMFNSENQQNPKINKKEQRVQINLDNKTTGTRKYLSISVKMKG